MTAERRIRFNRTTGLIVVPMGVLSALVSVVAGSPLTAMAGGVLVLLGVLYCVGTALVVLPHEVQVRNAAQITMKRVPIQGLADLHVDGIVLRRAADGKRIASLSALGTHADDVAALRLAVLAAQGAPTR